MQALAVIASHGRHAQHGLRARERSKREKRPKGRYRPFSRAAKRYQKMLALETALFAFSFSWDYPFALLEPLSDCSSGARG